MASETHVLGWFFAYCQALARRTLPSAPVLAELEGSLAPGSPQCLSEGLFGGWIQASSTMRRKVIQSDGVLSVFGQRFLQILPERV